MGPASFPASSAIASRAMVASIRPPSHLASLGHAIKRASRLRLKCAILIGMFTIAYISQKGGSGKTTLACATAVAFEAAGFQTVLVDLDPQASAAQWGDLRAADTPIVTSAQAARLPPVLQAARNAGARSAIIDTAPHAADAALATIRQADLVLIPCRPSAADLGAIGATIELTRVVPTPAWVVLNAAPVRSPLVSQAEEAIERYGLRTAPAVIHQRIDHVHAFTDGLAATELAPAGKAAHEIHQLFRWIATQREGDPHAEAEVGFGHRRP